MSPNRCFEAGDGDGGRQDQRAGGAEIVFGDLGQCLAAVGRRREGPAALGAHHRDQQVNERHEQRAEYSRQHRAAGHLAGLLHPETPDGIHHDDAEGQAG